MCVCVCVCVPRLYPAFPWWGVLCGRVCWAQISAAPRPSWLGCWGVRAVVRVPRLPLPFLGSRLWRGGVRVFPLFGSAPPPPIWFPFLGGGGFVVSVAGCPGLGSRGLCPPILSLPGRVVCCFSFVPVLCVSACFVCFFSRWAAALGLVLRVLAGWSPGAPLGGPVFGAVWVGIWPHLVVLVGGVVAVGRSRAPSPLFIFSAGGSACSSFCFPWAGARSGWHSVWLSSLLLMVAFCQAVPWPHGSVGLCTRWDRRPFLPGWVLALPGGQLRQAASCGPGLAVSFRLRGAGFNFLAAACVGGPPLSLPGVRWPSCRCVAGWCGSFQGCAAA